jgi:O-acetyl-ADP-ribose deacetylase (regulator of RNase III)
VAPAITSGAAANAIDENSGGSRVVYSATSTDKADIATGSTVYRLKDGSDTGLTIDSATGAVRLTANPNFEAQSVYAFTLVATDTAGYSSEQAVTLAINNLDEVAPQITSLTSTVATVFSGGAPQLVYTASAADEGDISAGLQFSLKLGSDPALRIDGVTGQLVLTGQPHRKAYAFTLIATDAAGNTSERLCELQVTMLGAAPQAYDPVRQVEVIRAANGSVSFVLQGERLMVDSTQLALVGETLIGSAPVQAAMPSDRSGVVPRVLVVSMSAPARDGVAGLLEAAGTAASHEHSASTQALAMPEPSTWLSRSRGESSTTPSAPLPSAVSPEPPEPAELPADADVEAVPKGEGERANPGSTGRSPAVPADFLDAQPGPDAAESPSDASGDGAPGA